jgi:MoaA/NifB/PqqE/SkfB family radical SAM enzyme
MAGIPGETRQELVATLDAARSLLDRFAAVPLVQFATPMPGARRFDAPATPEIGQRMQHAPTFLPEGVSANELILAVRLLRQRALAASTAKVIINLTYRCNNHCLFCAVGNRVKQDMPLDTVLALLRTHREQGISQLDLDGGEPTLHPDLMAVIAQAVRLGYHPINVTTNGRRLAYPDFAARLLGSGIHSLLISIHGPNSQVHDAITGVPGSFRETIAGIRNAMLMKPPHLDAGVNTTLSTGNVPLLRQLVEILYPLGVDKLNVQFVTPFGRASASSVPPPDQAARALRPVIEEWKDRIRFQVVNLPCCFLPGLEEFVAPDLGKLARNMVFVTLEEVNLYHYLAATRRYDNACASCLLRVACDGKFDFSEVLS